MFWSEVDIEVFSDSLEAREFCDADFFDAEVALRDIYSFPAPGGLQEAFNNGEMLPISHQQVQVLQNIENFCVFSRTKKLCNMYLVRHQPHRHPPHGLGI